MTNNETIISIISKFEECERDGTDYFDEKLTAKECGIVIEALEKQVPKKPVKIICLHNKNLYNLFCPRCDHYLGRLDDRVGYADKANTEGEICGFCGQNIDWSDSE